MKPRKPATLTPRSPAEELFSSAPKAAQDLLRQHKQLTRLDQRRQYMNVLQGKPPNG